METAIKKAIEGGWKPIKDWHFVDETMFDIPNIIWTREIVLLDPLFWQALGKAEGWQERFVSPKVSEHYKNDSGYAEWQYHWHRFIDHMVEGKSVDEFFEKLLTKE